ncbi:putative signal peptide-containing protein [Cryptosporidium canis]|uniref:Signal peptide-containing protein n=1 Tax=Cryptosporidium canis TaxID=195482 RepID=A0ABQ8P3X5_9CRYT|nr:putative signal peptide-containing protein [Cryptosporidium canis]
MRLESLSIFSLFVVLLLTTNHACFAADIGFNSFSSVSYVQDNQQRFAALTAYKKKINDSNKKIHKLKKLLSRLMQLQNDSYPSGSGFDSNFKSARNPDRRPDNVSIEGSGGAKGGGALSSVGSGDDLEKRFVGTVLSLVEEQTNFMNLLLKRMIIFWNPSFNFGVDISSKSTMERGFLDMLGLGDRQIWSGSSFGGKLVKATESDNGERESVEKLIGLTEFYRYSMVYNYIHIIGSIYRHAKNFERTVRSRLRLFRNMRERLISSRDSLALLLDTDLPDDVSLPYPVFPPCYLNMAENCNVDIYNRISGEISFFKEVQDENKELSIRIRGEPCDDHEVTGCTGCEIKKLSVSLIEWAFNDIQLDLLRLERDLKLCLDSIKQNSNGDIPVGPGSTKRDAGSGSGGRSRESYEGDRQAVSPDEAGLGPMASKRDQEGEPGSAGLMGRRGAAHGGSEIKRYKRRSLHHRTSRRNSKRRSLKSRRSRMVRRLRSTDQGPRSAEEEGSSGPLASEAQVLNLNQRGDGSESERAGQGPDSGPAPGGGAATPEESEQSRDEESAMDFSASLTSFSVDSEMESETSPDPSAALSDHFEAAATQTGARSPEHRRTSPSSPQPLAEGESTCQSAMHDLRPAQPAQRRKRARR